MLVPTHAHRVCLMTVCVQCVCGCLRGEPMVPPWGGSLHLDMRHIDDVACTRAFQDWRPTVASFRLARRSWSLQAMHLEPCALRRFRTSVSCTSTRTTRLALVRLTCRCAPCTVSGGLHWLSVVVCCNVWWCAFCVWWFSLVFGGGYCCVWWWSIVVLGGLLLCLVVYTAPSQSRNTVDMHRVNMDGLSVVMASVRGGRTNASADRDACQSAINSQLPGTAHQVSDAIWVQAC